MELKDNFFGEITAYINIPNQYPFYAPYARFELNVN